MGFQHSGMVLDSEAPTSVDNYRDKTGFMGFSNANDDTIKCFNAPKSYQSGWYSSRDVTLDSASLSLENTMDNPRTFELVGIADFENASGEEVVTIKLEDDESPYYIGFNRKTGIQFDTEGPPDKVIVSIQDDAGQSWLLADLDKGEVYDIADYFGEGKHARVEVLGFITEGHKVAQVAIYPMECVNDIALENQIGSLTYDSLPINIISQDTTSVTIEVANTWSKDVVSKMFVQYDESNLDTTCKEMQEVAKTDTPSQYTIACMSGAPVALVDIFVTDDSFPAADSTATVPECCHPEADVAATPTVQYTYKLACRSLCSAGGIQRQLLRGSSQEKKGK
jgi:hypothetical protein